jgi:lysophospholipase L1-like esterase
MHAGSVARKLLPLLFSFVILVAMDLATRAVISLFDLQLDIVVIHPNLGQAELKRQIYMNDRFLLWKMKPNLDGQFVSPARAPEDREPPLFRVVTNSKGFAGAEFSTEKREGTFRIVCMGNSSTFGWGVPPDSCYPRLLEGILQERIGHEVEVINAGVPGYTSVQGLGMLERDVSDLSPDLITLAFGANDCHATSRSDTDIMLERAGYVGAIQEILAHSSIYRVLRYFVVSSKVKHAVTGEEPPGRRRVSPKEYRAAMESIIQTSRGLGSKLILVEILPDSPEWEPYRKILEELAALEHLPLLGTGEIFRRFLEDMDATDGSLRSHVEAMREEYGESVLARHPEMYLRLDRVHPSDLGHLLIARALSDTVSLMIAREGK